MNKALSIYIHIPFCKRKCNYCAFSSFCAESSLVDKYLNLLCKEIVDRKTSRPIKTIYIGGGTPTILNENQITLIVETLRKNYDLSKVEEFTIEANPNSISLRLLETYKSLGINRLSVGVQTLSDTALEKIGRLHTANEAIEKIRLAKTIFENISADLIIGLENQSGKEVCQYAKKLIDAGVKHISCYLLEIYENTPLYLQIESGKYKPLDDEKTIEVFSELAESLKGYGLKRYEISNFASEGCESKHNLNYWQRGEYFGFGLSAHSFVGKNRIKNSDNFDDYERGEQEIEELSEKEEIEENVMLGLRCDIGVNLRALKKYSYDLSENGYFKEYCKQGILQVEQSANGIIIKLNPKFYHLSNTIISNLLPD
ncbi:MAG: radical SAM family heme chaperone HemW [Clostridia bacterium]|nr:radical SAM family heme chaperone HemW [Clostridia bacterium]